MLGPVLRRGLDYAATVDGMAAFENEMDLFKNATHLARKMGGVSATYEEDFGA